ncbi:MAG: UDP-N-acetylglucosamine 2-epimerase (non-hydrolyzing) [Alphaproteobacteria bacterium]|nr:UDP-N-acetylglucosamine 2-epimerase (non-hydrolyzing) [Alphaproteobacteria bacterium]
MRFLCVVGTRPEAIKLAPVILELSRHAQVVTLCSGQHTDLAREPLTEFGIEPDDEIVIPNECRTLAALTGAMLAPLECAIERHNPDVAIAQGDTTTVLVTALAAFYLHKPFAHVEAGLRTGNLRAPFPEEFNRIAAGRIADWHFCPTERAMANLRAEGVDPAHMVLTGNTGIDALRLILERRILEGRPPEPARGGGLRQILLTAHRRENQGPPLVSICEAVLRLIDAYGDIEFRIPVHPSPAVRETVERLLGGRDRIVLLPPLGYSRLVSEMARAALIVTDSGGIQEEAPFLKKPVLVMRDVTERPEVVELGVAKLVGTDADKLVGAVGELLDDPAVYARMATGGSPYGDGYAAQRIAAAFGLGRGGSS